MCILKNLINENFNIQNTNYNKERLQERITTIIIIKIIYQKRQLPLYKQLVQPFS